MRFLQVLVQFAVVQAFVCAQSGGTLSIVEAGQTSIRLHPQLGEQREQININRGYLLQQQGAFDLNLSGSLAWNRAVTPLLPSSQTAYGVNSVATDSLSTAVGASQLYRSGLSISPSIQLGRSADNLSNPLGVNQPTVGIQITQPLLRNRGREAVTAAETAAGMEVSASVYDLNYVASQVLTSTATAYWNYLAAHKNVEVYRESERRGETFLENVRAMASADVVPRIQVQDAEANAAGRRASRIGAEQTEIQAQQQLAIAMGLRGKDVLSVGVPADPFPEIDTQSSITTDQQSLVRLSDQALKNRADYLSANLRSGEQKALLAGSRNRVKPRLDVVANIGYTGIRSGAGLGNYLGPLFLGTAGPNGSVGLQYEFPKENRVARGELLQNEAALRQQELRADDVARNITSAVVTAANAVNNAASQYRQAHLAAAAAAAGREGETERLRQGIGSVLDVLQTEDRYISAILSQISAQVSFAVAIANFRFATGTYLDPAKPIQSVEREAFYRP